MHLIKDENGNLIPHGHGDCQEHTHGEGHTHPHGSEGCPAEGSQGHCGACASGGDAGKETVALLSYMLSHNEHHASELDQMAENLKKMGMEAAAKTIREAVSDFQKGNMRLGLALTLVKEELKQQ